MSEEFRNSIKTDISEEYMKEVHNVFSKCHPYFLAYLHDRMGEFYGNPQKRENEKTGLSDLMTAVENVMFEKIEARNQKKSVHKDDSERSGMEKSGS